MPFPLPPTGIARTPASTTGQAIMEAAIAFGFVTVYVAAARLSARHRTWLPVAVALGSTFAALIEPLPDAVADLWYYTPKQHTIYTSFGDALPVWTFFSYTVFYGGLGLLCWWLIERGLDRRRILLLCAFLAAGLAGAELVMINVMKVYTYFGPSAFAVAHFPLWICLLNTAIILMIGCGLAAIRRALPNRSQLLRAFLLPAASMVLGLLFLPMVLWTVIHSSETSTGLVYAATVVTIGLALAVMFLTSQAIPSAGFVPMADVSRGSSRPR